MLKKILFSLLGLAIIIIAGLFFFGPYILNKGVTTAINTFGSTVTQTPVSVEAVDLSLTSGRGGIHGFVVGNPEGYKSENILEVQDIEVEVATSSLTSDTVVVNKLHIVSPKISYEKTLKGNNIKDLQKNIQAFTEKLLGEHTQDLNDEKEAKGVDQDDKKIIIEDFKIVDGTIYAGLMGVGMEIPLPTISLENIGASDGPTFAESLEQVFREILNVIGSTFKDSTEIFTEGGKATLDVTKEQILDRGVSELQKLFN
ncbi:MAG: Uncharacterised protein [Opitutia bacterium UBA7350]|nr:MAG: Uncharacterised protein [Opitutae bacterium UBA7350]